MSSRKQDFIPCTMARHIGGGVLFRPIKSWHSATYAGEGLDKMPGGEDRSGCVFSGTVIGRDGSPITMEKLCMVPYTVTHRIYWHESDPDKTVSAFLSYLNAMGYCGDGEYFWETYGISDDIERFTGDSAEQEMETFISEHFRKQLVDAA